MRLLPSILPAVASGLALLFGAVPTSGAAVMPRDTTSSSPSSSPAGLLSLDDGKALFTFRYSTPNPNPNNWIGIYDAHYGGPENEVFVQPSLAWAYAPDKDGEVRVSVSNLQPGLYKAFFLAKNGYEWLAQPIQVVLPGSGPIEFVTDRVTTQNARQGSSFEAKLGGLIANPKDGKTKFTTEDAARGADWVHVSSDGTISGTPGSSDRDADLVVVATASDGTAASIKVRIPVRPAGKPLVQELKVMSYNMWFGGSKVNDYHNKQVRFLVNSNVDIVGLQESWDGQATRLAKALGWHHWQSHEVGIISRYPIVQTYPEQAAGGSVRIALDGDESQVIIWNVHLGFDPYGPYDFCFDHMPLDRVLEREAQSGRTPQIIEIVSAMQDKLANADNVPVLLVGDFNAPSHLDWNDANRRAHCGIGHVPWPTSEFPIQSGLVDSFREAHPDPRSEPGITWSPIYLDNDGHSEPLDRIDFVYHKGRDLKVVKSETLVAGSPKPEPNHQDNEWTSDHSVVMTTYWLLRHDERQEL